MKQGVRSTLIFPIGKDQTAISMAIAQLLRDGWQFVGIHMEEIHLARTWECEREDGQVETRIAHAP